MLRRWPASSASSAAGDRLRRRARLAEMALRHRAPRSAPAGPARRRRRPAPAPRSAAAGRRTRPTAAAYDQVVLAVVCTRTSQPLPRCAPVISGVPSARRAQVARGQLGPRLRQHLAMHHDVALGHLQLGRAGRPRRSSVSGSGRAQDMAPSRLRSPRRSGTGTRSSSALARRGPAKRSSTPPVSTQSAQLRARRAADLSAVRQHDRRHLAGRSAPRPSRGAARPGAPAPARCSTAPTAAAAAPAPPTRRPARPRGAASARRAGPRRRPPAGGSSSKRAIRLRARAAARTAPPRWSRPRVEGQRLARQHLARGTERA